MDVVGQTHRGGVYNSEEKRPMLAHAFRPVRSVVFRVHPANLRFQRAVEKLRAVRVASQPDSEGRGENYVDRLEAPARGRE